ncbi:MAG: NACHT domain-containing protein, partial [Chthoniobacteraceae bacterium]
MKIDRSKLISDLLNFATSGNGLIIGQPGVGKSYAIAELCVQLKAKGIPHLLLPVERLGSASEIELKTVLRREGHLVSLLRAIDKDPKQPGILIFDGFDAARGEDERGGVFRLIRQTVSELRQQWNTIVSVRTFDAKKSQRLLELFPDVKPEAKSNSPSSRQFLIPVLREDEIEQALEQIPDLRLLHKQGTEAFRLLLKFPFNLWLIERVLREGAKISEFSQITSEVELLEMYWRYRIRKGEHSDDRDFILKTATDDMVNHHALIARRDHIYRPEVRDVWEELLSDEVLTEIAERERSIAFTHNILFDFAVSVYLLDPEPTKLAEFVAADSARPFFLRPSLVYHFTRLWHFDRAGFWRHFWLMVQHGELNFRQIVRLILPAIIVSEAQTADDISPLLERLRTGRAHGVEAVAFLLRALRVLKFEKTALWTQFLRSIGQYLDQRFAWDAGLIAMGIVDSQELPTEQSLSDCGFLGRRLLAWSWASRKNEQQGPWFERLAALIAIPLVAKTFVTGEDEARLLLQNVLAVLDEPDFPVDCIYRLTNDVRHLISHDPELVGLIYERVFGYEELSVKQTSLGGIIMPLTSNRRQDYDMCRYCLIKEFPRFLASATLYALKAGIRAVEAFVLENHVSRYLREGKSLEDITFEFQFRNNVVYYTPDSSVVWDNKAYPDREIQIVDSLFHWLAAAANVGKSKDVDAFIEIFEKNARLAFLWSRLLTVGAEVPSVFGPLLWELAIAKPVLNELDTLQALGTFLEKTFEFLSESQRRQIEEAILDLGRVTGDEQKEWFKHRRDRLIARIPEGFLLTDEGRQLRSLLESENKLLPNTPLF